MPTAASTLIQHTRRYLRDWPEGDVLTGSMTSSTLSFSVADATIYSPGWLVQVDQEAMQVRSAAGVAVNVLRGARGSTAVTHASGATVLLRPAFTDLDILDSLNAALDASYPKLYRPVNNEFTGDDQVSYEYDIPIDATLGTIIPYISRLEYKGPGELSFRRFRGWQVERGDVPLLKLNRPLTGGGTLRIVGFGPFPHLTSVASTLDSFFPANAEDLLVEYAAQRLLLFGEAGRVRTDTGAKDQRENANRTGSSSSAATAIFQRWNIRLQQAAMPPMPPHTVSIW